MTLQASADITLKQGSPNKSFGSETTLTIKEGGRRVLLQFDGAAIAAAVSGGSLASAALQVYVGYGFIGSHLVLFSSDPKWRVRVEHLDLPAESRFSAIYDLVFSLRNLVPSLAQLQVPGLKGNPDYGN